MSMTAASIPADIQLRSVLIATDFSPASAKALRHALSIARQYGAKLYAMHVVSSMALTIAGPEAIAQATSAALRDAALTERRLVSSGALKDIHHQVIIRQGGDIWAELEAVIRDKGIDLLVLGTHGRTGLRRLALGSVAEQIFRNARCRVLTVGPCSRPDAPFMRDVVPGPVLFPTDFSDASLSGLPLATSYANQRIAQLVLIHMLAPAPRTEGSKWYTAEDVVKIRATAEAAALKRLQELVTNVRLAVEPAFVANFGEPAEGILRAAESLHAEIIIVGLKDRSHMETISHLPWSTAYGVVCAAVCPVLTVRTDNAWQ